MEFRLGKNYKLCSEVLIEDVFSSGSHLKSYPFVLKYKVCELKQDVPFQIVFSAPKRTFRKAVERNRIKRLCKEAFRLQKAELEKHLKIQGKQLALFLVYTPKEELTLSLLKGRTDKLIKKLITQLETNDALN